jgi:serine/threonine protein kinase
MIAGTRPFAGPTALDARGDVVLRAPAPLPRDIDISPELQHVVDHCLEQDPAARFQSARDLAFVLEFTLRAPQPVRHTAPPRGRLASVLRRL